MLQHLSDYDKQLLKDPAYTCIVKTKGKGAGAETMMPVLRSQWAKMKAERINNGGIKEVDEWKEVPSNTNIIKQEEYIVTKTPQEIIAEASRQIEQPATPNAIEVETQVKKRGPKPKEVNG